MPTQPFDEVQDLSQNIVRKLTDPPRANSPVLLAASMKSACEDFVVEEVPKYLPSGSGEHLFLWIEKQGVAAGAFLQHVQRTLEIQERDIGAAGQKDRHAVTRQFISIPVRCRPLLKNLDTDRIRLLSVSAHGNKLRTGHLVGNQFQIVLRNADSPFSSHDVSSVSSRLKHLSAEGFPNYFGPQRFGHQGNTVNEGIRVFRGNAATAAPRRRKKGRQKRFAMSAIQSAVFNLVLAERVAEFSFTKPKDGDVVCRRDGIRPFLFDDRGDTSAADLVPMGPMPGRKMMAATGEVASHEAAVIEELKLTPDDFANSSKQMPGTRRKMVEFPSNCSAALTADGAISVRFHLPAGSYATVLLAEICGDLMDASQVENP